MKSKYFFAGIMLIGMIIAGGNAMKADAASMASITAANATGTPGTTVTIPLSFDPGTNSVADIQFTLTFPGQISSSSATTGPIVTAAGKDLLASSAPGSLSFIIGGLSNASIGSGNLADASLNLPANLPAGTYAITPTNITMSDPNAQAVQGIGTAGSLTVIGNTATSTPTSTPSADLAITDTVSNANPMVGDTINYSVTVSNTGSANASGVVVTDPLPSGLTFESAVASVGSYASSTGTWTIGNVTNGSLATLYVQASVNSGTAGQTITNTATLSGTSSSASVTVQTASIATSTNPGGPTTTSTTPIASSTPPTPCTLSPSQFHGDIQNGSISFTNISVSAKTATWTIANHTSCGAPISLSSYGMFVPVGAAGWLSSQELAGTTSASLAASSTVTLSVPLPSCMAQIDAWYDTAPTTLLDSNPYAYPHVPFLLTANYSSAPLCMSKISMPTSTPSIADLAITKTVDNATPYQGDTINYTVSVSDLGPANATGVVAADTLPSGLTFENATASVGSYASTTGTWTIGNLNVSSTATLNIAALVNSGTAGQTITNTATVGENASTTDNNSSNNSASVTVNVQSPCTLSASQFEAAVSSGTITFSGIGFASGKTTFTLANHTSCSAPISLAAYEMFVPQGATPTWLSSQQLFSVVSSSVPGNSTQTLSVSLPSCMVQIDAYYGEAPTKLLDSNPYSYPNVPFLLAYAVSGSPLCTMTTQTSTPSIANLAITKTVDDATPVVGDTVNYTLTVSALGPATSTGVVATDTLPSGLTFENATASVGSYATTTGTWTIGDMSASSTAQLMIAALVNSSDTVGQVITNTGIVGESASSTNNNPSNSSSSVSITVQPTGCPSNCGGGSGPTTPATSTLTVDISGLNASDTAAISVADLGPTATTTQATSTGNGSSTFVLPTNDQYALAATTTAPNYSVATSSGCSGTLSANMTCSVVFTLASSTATTTPSNAADITIAKTVDNANPAGGDTINYTLTVTALGPVTSTFVQVQDVFPLGLSLASMTPSQGSTTDGGTINWNVGTLSPNATATLQIAAVVSPAYDGQTITNTATVSELSSLVETNLSVTSSSVSINVQPAPCTSNCGGGGGGPTGGGGISTAQIGITKTVDNATPNPGDTIHYTLTMQSAGPADAIGVVATDTLPAGVTFVSASSSAGTYASSTGTWTLGTVAPNANPTLVITATVNSSDPIGEVITNTATIGESTSVNNPITTNDTSSATITVGGSNGGGGGGGGGGGSTGVPSGGGGTIVGGGGGGSTGGGGEVLGASASCGIYLDQYIHPIRKDLNSPVEVDKLQTFLNMNLGTTLPITGYYGPETIAAVNQFQVKYHIEVLRPWLNYGLPTEYTPTDYVYKTTQRWINLIMCSSLNLPIPQLP